MCTAVAAWPAVGVICLAHAADSSGSPKRVHTHVAVFVMACCGPALLAQQYQLMYVPIWCCLCRNALAYVLFSEGIPYIYYGTEQGFTTDREPLWHSGYSKQHPLWLFLRIAVAYRKEGKVR